MDDPIAAYGVQGLIGGAFVFMLRWLMVRFSSAQDQQIKAIRETTLCLATLHQDVNQLYVVAMLSGVSKKVDAEASAEVAASALENINRNIDDLKKQLSMSSFADSWKPADSGKMKKPDVKPPAKGSSGNAYGFRPGHAT